MQKKLAVKRLTRSDLTFFEWQFKNINAGNQKSINLNANIFTGILYRDLPEIAASMGNRLSLDLSIYGPGLYGRHNLQRKIIKGKTYKNWRLNGEFVYNPDSEPERYNSLRQNDFAIFEFIGVGAPIAANLFLISKDNPEDQNIHASLEVMMNNSSMINISLEVLIEIIERSKILETHPLRILSREKEIESIALGGNVDFETFHSPNQLTLSSEELKKAKRSAEINGERGEEFVWTYLSSLQDKGVLTNIEWTSQKNAISPYDFCVDSDEGPILIDAKSTSSGFNSRIHISMNEIRQVLHTENLYAIYRIYEMEQATAKLKVAIFPKELAKDILSILDQLPVGIKAEGISLTPKMLDFSHEIFIEISDE